jgi:RHS repeat-associated protein
MLTHGAVTMVYDGDGNRVSETVGGTATKYLVDTVNPTGYAQVIDELVSGAVTRTYAYGLQRISENQKIGTTQTASFYGYDGHGNVRFLTGTAGTATDTYVYDAFGLPLTTTGTTPNSFLYSAEQFDSTLGMYYLRARYYNPATGRFLTMDPYEGHTLEPATLHKYLYVGANPVRFADPSGYDAAENATIRIELSEALQLGPNVTVRGFLEVTEGHATAFVDLIEGTIRSPFSLLPKLVEAATALGAESLDVVAQFANERLLDIAVERYGFVTIGGYEVWSVKF